MSSSEFESASELIKLFYAAHLTSRENERDLMMGDPSSGEGFSKQQLLEIPPVRNSICFPEETEQVNIARSTANDYLLDPTKKLPKTDTPYSSIKTNVNRIISQDFSYFTFKEPFNYKKRKTIGGWDFENCPVPETFTKEAHYKEVIPNIEKCLKKWKFIGPFEEVVGVGNTGRLNGYNYLMQESKLTLIDERKIDDEKDTADKGLIVEMRIRMEEHLLNYNEPGNILLMTGDVDFIGIIREARKLGFFVILAYNEDHWIASELKTAPDKLVKWNQLVKGKA